MFVNTKNSIQCCQNKLTKRRVCYTATPKVNIFKHKVQILRLLQKLGQFYLYIVDLYLPNYRDKLWPSPSLPWVQ
jgi:hypothetical protein